MRPPGIATSPWNIELIQEGGRKRRFLAARALGLRRPQSRDGSRDVPEDRVDL